MALLENIEEEKAEAKLTVRWRRASATLLFTMLVVAGFVGGGIYLITH